MPRHQIIRVEWVCLTHGVEKLLPCASHRSVNVTDVIWVFRRRSRLLDIPNPKRITFRTFNIRYIQVPVVGCLFRINKLLRLTSNNLSNCNNVVVGIADRVLRDKGVAAGSFADELLSFVDVCRVHEVWLHKRYFRLWSCTFDIMHMYVIHL